MNKLKRSFLALLFLLLPLFLTSCTEKDYTYVAVEVGQLQAPSVDRNSEEYREKYATLGRYENTVELDVAVCKFPLESGVLESTTPFNQTFNQIALDVLNIKLNYVVVANSSNYDSTLGFYMTDQGLPDMFYTTNSALYSELAADGMLADLSDAFWYLNDELQENYLEHFPSLLPTVMQEGKLYSFPTVSNQYATAQRLYIRQDWLDIVNMDAPTTMEEMYEVGKAFADNKAKIAAATGIKENRVIPFAMTKELTWSGSYSAEGFFNCYRTSINSYFDDGQGNLVFSNTTPEMKEALTMLNKMYTNGVLDNDFMTKTSDQVESNIKSGYVGMAFGEWWMPKDTLGDCIERVPGSEWTWVDLPAPEGKTSQPIVKRVNVSGYNLVSKDCKNPEAAAKLINLFYDIYYNDEAIDKYGDRVLPSKGFYYQFVPIKLWDGIASIREYERAQEVFDNLYELGFNPANYIDPATYAEWGVYQAVNSTTKDDYIITSIEGQTYVINRDVINAIKGNKAWSDEFFKLKNREKTLHFADGYAYFVAFKNGVKLDEMSKAERSGWGIYHEMIDPTGGYAFVVDLTYGKVTAKYDEFYGANLTAMADKLPYITTQTGLYFARMIVGEMSLNDFESQYVQAVVMNNGGDIIVNQVNQWYKANKIDIDKVYENIK